MFKVTVTKEASSHTKNRIKNHGPKFNQLEEHDNPPPIIAREVGKPAVYLRNDAWFGWLPSNEIDWVEI